jgi:pilus assembly protein CpaE
MGAMLARGGKRTCIVDLDLQFGDALTALNLKGRCPISEVMSDLKAAGRQGLDRDHLWSQLPRYGSRLWVLSQVGCVEGLAGIGPDRLPRLLRAVRRCFDVTIVDGIRDFSDLALAALDVADQVVMVATQDVPTLRGLALRSDIFQQLGYELDELKIVLNRYSEKGVVPLAAISDSLDVEPAFLVSNEFRTVHRAINDGEPLGDSAPRARATRDIAAMVEQLYGVTAAEVGERQGLLKRILGGRT